MKRIKGFGKSVFVMMGLVCIIYLCLRLFILIDEPEMKIGLNESLILWGSSIGLYVLGAIFGFPGSRKKEPGEQ